METTTAAAYLTRSVFPVTTTTASAAYQDTVRLFSATGGGRARISCRRGSVAVVCSLEKSAGGVSSTGSSSSSNGKKSGGAGAGMPNSKYVVPLDKATCITRPLAEILRDLNKRVPDNIIKTEDNSIPWYHANRMLSFYAPGWCGEIRDIYSNNGSVTVVYRVTVRGSDGEAHRESTGTVSSIDGGFEDPVAAAEEMAFCRACARFGFGLYLYHEDEML